MAKVKGICKNIDADCSMAFNKTIQEVDKDDFVCAECGAPLKEATGKDAKPKKDNKPMLAAIIGAIIVIAAVAVIGHHLDWWGGSAPDTEQGVADPDTLGVDSVGVVLPGEDSVEVNPAGVEPVGKEPIGKEPIGKEPVKGAAGHNLGYGTYSGGYPTGVGTIDITAAHNFETANGTVSANSGDKVVSAKFKDGSLVQGELQRTDGTRAWLNLGAN